MEHIHQLITHVFKRHGSNHYFTLLRAWNDIMGRIADQTRLETLDGSTLVIGVYQPQWMQELHFCSQMIRDRVNAYVEAEVVQMVRFKLVTQRSRSQRKHRKEVSKRQQAPAMGQKQQQVLHSIHDEQLRSILTHVYYTCDGA